MPPKPRAADPAQPETVEGTDPTDGPHLLECAACGARRRGLAQHARRIHGLGSAAYRQQYGLPPAAPLTAPARTPGPAARNTGDRNRARAAKVRAGLDDGAQQAGYANLEAFISATAHLTAADAGKKLGKTGDWVKHWRGIFGVRGQAHAAARAELDREAERAGYPNLATFISGTTHLPMADAGSILGRTAAWVRHWRNAFGVHGQVHAALRADLDHHAQQAGYRDLVTLLQTTRHLSTPQVSSLLGESGQWARHWRKKLLPGDTTRGRRQQAGEPRAPEPRSVPTRTTASDKGTDRLQPAQHRAALAQRGAVPTPPLQPAAAGPIRTFRAHHKEPAAGATVHSLVRRASARSEDDPPPIGAVGFRLRENTSEYRTAAPGRTRGAGVSGDDSQVTDAQTPIAGTGRTRPTPAIFPGQQPVPMAGCVIPVGGADRSRTRPDAENQQATQVQERR